MKVLLIDDHAMFTESLVSFLRELDRAIDCVTAPTLRAALQLTGPFDLVLLDLHLPDGHGFEGLRAVTGRFEGAPVTIVSADERPDTIRAAIDAGAMGYVPKSASVQVLVAAMRLVLAGGSFLPLHVLHRVVPPAPRSPREVVDMLGDRLTERQIEVLMKVLQGKPNKVIARELNLAEGTVKSHLSTAFRVLEVTNRTEAVFKASQLGLTLHPGAPH